MHIDPHKLSGTECGCRYQKDYIARANSHSESATLECIKFYTDGRIRFEQHCYGEAACCIFALWAKSIDSDGIIEWDLPSKGYYDAAVLPHQLICVDENGWLYFDQDHFPWKLAESFSCDPSAGYPKWKMLLRRLIHS